MLKYTVKKAFMGVLTLAVVITATFFLMKLIPGGPFLAEKAADKAVTKALEKKYGLDKPLMEQFFTYVGGILKGDFGPSLKQRGWQVSDIIKNKFPVSAKLGLMAMALALTLGIAVGCWAAFRRGKFTDRVVSVFCAAGVAIPTFVSSTFLIYFLGEKLGWFPITGLGTWRHWIMPVVSLSIYPLSYITRLTRSSMLDVMEQDYMRTAKAKGVSTPKRIFKHALRNGVIPVISYAGPFLGALVTGSMVVEKAFALPGLGGQFIAAITNRDYTLIMGTTIFLSAIIILMNIVVDILYSVVNPQIKLQ